MQIWRIYWVSMTGLREYRILLNKKRRNFFKCCMLFWHTRKQKACKLFKTVLWLDVFQKWLANFKLVPICFLGKWRTVKNKFKAKQYSISGNIHSTMFNVRLSVFFYNEERQIINVTANVRHKMTNPRIFKVVIFWSQLFFLRLCRMYVRNIYIELHQLMILYSETENDLQILLKMFEILVIVNLGTTKMLLSRQNT